MVRKGDSVSEDVRRRISETLKSGYKEGRIIHPLLGKHFSMESKRKMSETRKRLIREGKVKIPTSRGYPCKKRKFHLTKEELYRLYWEKNLTINQIAEKIGMGYSSVERWLKKYNIKSRVYGSLDRPMSLESIRKMSETKKRLIKEGKIDMMNLVRNRRSYNGKGNPMYGKKRPDFALRYGNPEEFTKKQLKALIKRPNKPEQKLIDIISNHNLPYKYVGDGQFILGGKCPDFLNCDGGKQVMEVFGRTYHSPLFSFSRVPYKRTYQGTMEHYKKYGFKCLILWEHELENEKKVVEKIATFK